MAVILRNSASRAARNTPSSTIPIRSSKITVAQTGLISSLTGANNQTINAINLGYQGDNEVTQIQVKLWENAQNLTLNYEAWIVFYNENSASSTTLTLSADGNDGEYSLLVPESITSKPGNYQLYVVLNERTGYSEGGSGGVGPVDDPAYRETFVSAGCKAVVNDKSGYSLLKNFDWENIYNYDKGIITIDDKEWTLTDGGKYSTSIFLGGLELEKVDEINVIPPEGIEVTHSMSSTEEATEGERERLAKTLIIQAEIKNENLSTDYLDYIKIEYPIKFTEPNIGSNYAQKIPIKVIQEPYSIAVDSNYNTTLGMKFDAYSTPIDVSGLINLPDQTDKYVIFRKGTQPIVCKAYGNYCWIPVSVTQEPGIWEVSFVGKNERYTYYTDILKLPVVDNTLTAEDLKTDTTQVAATSSDGQKMYDKNSHAIHVIGTSDGTLSYTRDEIDYAIGWVKDVSSTQSGEQFSAARVVEAIKHAEDWSRSKQGFDNRISDNTSNIGELRDDVNKNIIDIGDIKNTIQNLDVTALEARVTVNESEISSVKTNISSLQTTSSSHNSELLRLAAKDVSLESKITANETNIIKLEGEISSIKDTEIVNLKEEDRQLNQYISALRGRIDNNDADIARLDLVVDGHAAALEAHNKFGEMIVKEVADRAEADTKLRVDLESEIERATNRETELSTQISNNASAIDTLDKNTTDSFTAVNSKLDTEIKTRGKETSTLNSQVSDLKETSDTHGSQIAGVLTRTDTLESNTIRNDLNGPSEQLVLKIVFLKSEQEYESLAIKDAGTLYLIQEEE